MRLITVTDDNRGNDNDFHDDFDLFFFLTFIFFMLLLSFPTTQHSAHFIFAWIITDSTLNLHCQREHNGRAWGISIWDSVIFLLYAAVKPLIFRWYLFNIRVLREKILIWENLCTVKV